MLSNLRAPPSSSPRPGAKPSGGLVAAERQLVYEGPAIPSGPGPGPGTARVGGPELLATPGPQQTPMDSCCLPIDASRAATHLAHGAQVTDRPDKCRTSRWVTRYSTCGLCTRGHRCRKSGPGQVNGTGASRRFRGLRWAQTLCFWHSGEVEHTHTPLNCAPRTWLQGLALPAFATVRGSVRCDAVRSGLCEVGLLAVATAHSSAPQYKPPHPAPRLADVHARSHVTAT